LSSIIMRLAAVLAAASVFILPAATASSQPATPTAERAERGQLGVEVAHLLFKHMDFKALLQREMGKIDSMFSDFEGRPEWAGLMREAVSEAAGGMGPMVDEVVGGEFSRYFTLDELQAGVVFLRGPGGDALGRMISESAAGRTPPPLSQQGEREVQKLTRTAAGRHFLQKFGDVGAVLDTVKSEFVARFTLDVFRRFTDKALAAEAARRARPD
jgi:hypothetical protein